MAVLALIVPLGGAQMPVDPGYGVPAPPTYPTTGPVPPGWANRPVDPGYGRPNWSPVDPGYGIPTFGPHPSHPIAGVPPMYPSGQPVPPGWGGGQPVFPSQGLPVYPSTGPIIPPPPGIWGPPDMPPGVWPTPPTGGGGGGEGGEITNPIGGGFVLVWHPKYGFKWFPVGGLPPLEPGSGEHPDQGLPPTAEPKSY